MVAETVAQVIEQEVIGVDNMIYMRSVSGADGSYTLTVSFLVGTDPDINTVNVNNRVQIALASLPEEVSRQGVSVKKKSSAILQVYALYSPESTYDTLFLSNYATINILDRVKRVNGIGDAFLFGALDYSMRVWLDVDRLTQLNMTSDDVIAALQEQNAQAAVGRVGALADQQRRRPSAHLGDRGPAAEAGRIREHRDPVRSKTALSCGSPMSGGSNWGRGPATVSAASTATRARCW